MILITGSKEIEENLKTENKELSYRKIEFLTLVGLGLFLFYF